MPGDTIIAHACYIVELAAIWRRDDMLAGSRLNIDATPFFHTRHIIHLPLPYFFMRAACHYTPPAADAIFFRLQRQLFVDGWGIRYADYQRFTLT